MQYRYYSVPLQSPLTAKLKEWCDQVAAGSAARSDWVAKQFPSMVNQSGFGILSGASSAWQVAWPEGTPVPDGWKRTRKGGILPKGSTPLGRSLTAVMDAAKFHVPGPHVASKILGLGLALNFSGLGCDIYHPLVLCIGDRVIVGLPANAPRVHKDLVRISDIEYEAIRDQYGKDRPKKSRQKRTQKK